MANRGRHRKRHVKCILHVSKYHESWISDVLDDDTISKILEHQYNQSGIKNLTVFEKFPCAGKSQCGFIWSNTPEGHGYWEKIMYKIDDYRNKNIFEI